MSLRYSLIALLAMLIWSGNTIVGKLAAHAMPPGTIAFLRWLLAFMLLTPFVARSAWRHRRTIAGDLPKLAVLGLLGMAICQGLGYYAARYTSATNMALLLALIPLLTLLLGALFQATAPSGNTFLGATISLVGIAVVLGHGNPVAPLSTGVGIGDLLMLLVILALATYNVLLKNWSGALPLFTSLYVQIGCAVVFLAPVFLWQETATRSWANAAMVAYAAIPGSIVAPALWMAAIRHLGSARASIFMSLIPITTAAIAAIFLDEALHAYHLVGGGMTIAGVALGQRTSRRAPVAAKPA